jgi:hypothetical protein
MIICQDPENLPVLTRVCQGLFKRHFLVMSESVYKTAVTVMPDAGRFDFNAPDAGGSPLLVIDGVARRSAGL